MPGLHRLSKCQFTPGLHRLSNSLAVNARTVSYLSVLLPKAVYVRAASPIQVSVYARVHRLSKCQFTQGLHRLDKSLAVNARAVSPPI